MNEDVYAPRLIEARRLTPAEVAQKLGVSETTLANWRSQGKGPVSGCIGRNVFYYEFDVEAYLQEQRNKAYANKKTRTVVALPIHYRGTRVRRFDRATGHRSQPEGGRALREGPTADGEAGPQD